MLSGSIWAGVCHPSFFAKYGFFLLHSGIIITNKRGLYFFVHIHSNNLFNIYNFFTYNLLFVYRWRWECILLSSLAICLKSNQMSFCHCFVFFFTLNLACTYLKCHLFYRANGVFFFIQFQLNVSTLLSSNSMICHTFSCHTFFFVQFSLFFFLNIVLWPKKNKN